MSVEDQRSTEVPQSSLLARVQKERKGEDISHVSFEHDHLLGLEPFGRLTVSMLQQIPWF